MIQLIERARFGEDCYEHQALRKSLMIRCISK